MDNLVGCIIVVELHFGEGSENFIGSALPCQESRGPLGSSHVVVLVLWSTKKTRSSRVSRLSHNGGSSLSFAPLSSWKGWSESGVLRSVLRSSVKRDTKSTFYKICIV